MPFGDGRSRRAREKRQLDELAQQERIRSVLTNGSTVGAEVRDASSKLRSIRGISLYASFFLLSYLGEASSTTKLGVFSGRGRSDRMRSDPTLLRQSHSLVE